MDADDLDMCPRCGCCGMEWVDCDACGGEGETEPGVLYEEDPLWYGEDETAPCSACGGEGGSRDCGGGCNRHGKHEPEPPYCAARTERHGHNYHCCVEPGHDGAHRCGRVEWTEVSHAA